MCYSSPCGSQRLLRTWQSPCLCSTFYINDLPKPLPFIRSASLWSAMPDLLNNDTITLLKELPATNEKPNKLWTTENSQIVCVWNNLCVHNSFSWIATSKATRHGGRHRGNRPGYSCSHAVLIQQSGGVLQRLVVKTCENMSDISDFCPEQKALLCLARPMLGRVCRDLHHNHPT